MNVKDILKRLGYEILESNSEENTYTIKCSDEKKKRLLAQVESGDLAIEEFLNNTYTVNVTEVSFNSLGDLYVEFKEIGSEDIFDAYEHNNMQADELY